jgi:twitching motility protein PilI
MVSAQDTADTPSLPPDAAQQEQPTAPERSWLAVEAAGRGFVFALSEAGEIFSMVPLMPLPHAKDWFLGVANLRGHLHGVVDLGRFLGLQVAEQGREASTLVAFSPSFDVNAALRIDRLAGLRSEKQFELEGDADVAAPAFVGQRLRDADGRVWQEIRLAPLARHEAFLRIADRCAS